MAGGRDAAQEAAMTTTRLADICAMIREHAAAGTMSGRKVASICDMIEDIHVTGAEEGSRRSKRRGWERWRVGGNSTSCYRKIGMIGKGGYGVVVKAEHRRTGQTVAMKMPHKADAGELLREACFLAACRCLPYLVGLHSIARNPETKNYCLVMEYVGPSLTHALHQFKEYHHRPFPEVYVRRVMQQLLTGVNAMHERRIIHRDIKTGNILVSEDGGVKICDFGLAICTAKEAPPYRRVGTDLFMAPEMLLKKPDYDELVDMWSVGCAMALLLSGEVLFRGEGTRDLLHSMFDVVGVPSRNTCEFFKSKRLAHEAPRWLAKQQPEQHGGGDRLRELFPETMLSQDGFDVLKGLLTFHPNNRLTAAAALGHPWFAGATIDDPLIRHRRVSLEDELTQHPDEFKYPPDHPSIKSQPSNYEVLRWREEQQQEQHDDGDWVRGLFPKTILSQDV
ncbi:hypothetical protein GUJ93_ZPchr0002g26688 [Zizania palustris]|uniref:Protein kinase domain-containing protein n=1 Tax=Zizania palustris TaxID=103762 RepID=A0A8J5RD44_ZIZPA|nr:hypothetical protein GUJ93_ZPchr0002g26688 [Zizania palustris]